MERMATEDIESDQKEKPQKRIGLGKKIFILLIMFIICGLVFTIYVKTNETKSNSVQDTNSTFTNQTNVTSPVVQNDNTVTKSKTDAILFIVIFILVGAIGIIAYLLFREREKTELTTKKPISPDRATELFISHFSQENEIECYYNRTKELYVPTNSSAIEVGQRIPFFQSTTGDNFWIMEIEVKEGRMRGIHTVIIPIDKGEEIVKGGHYRLDPHVPFFQFQMHRVNYPLSSLEDKRDRINLAMLERAESGDISPDVVKTLVRPQPTIGTPLDQIEPQDTPTPTLGYSTTRPQSYSKRRSYRRGRY